MKRKFISRKVDDLPAVKQKMLNWVKQFGIFCFLDNQEYSFSNPTFECLLGAGSVRNIQIGSVDEFNSLQDFIDPDEWIFGHLGYDLKNFVEDLSSGNPDGIGFPDGFFFVPEVVVILNEHEMRICAEDAENVFQQIMSGGTTENIISHNVELKSRFSREEYISTAEKIKHHILRGDCYEINFCQEFYADDVEIDPLTAYIRLGEISPNPFSAFYRLDDKYLLCASPERFLKRTGDHIISQPIKGTAKRDLGNAGKDRDNKVALSASEKERSENVMIVDLVRNDLSKVCVEGSVMVEALFDIYSFPQVHQMISTVGGTVSENVSFIDIIKATFPMGSMTGAPKKRVMELIEQYERTRRGLFSGSVGYIKPGGDFDFNVVIRSILYNSSSKYISVQAGSAITFASKAECEYEECLDKIEGVRKVLRG